MEICDEKQRFLVYSLLEIDINELKDNETTIKEAKIKCCRRAYRDLNRTIKYKDSKSALKESTMSEKELDEYAQNKENAVKAVCEYITGMLCEIANCEDWHKNACDNIIEKFNEGYGNVKPGVKTNQKDGKLTYGQAQKWLNMSLKYMDTIGLIDSTKSKKLHPPIDNIILESIWMEEAIADDAFPLKKGKERRRGDGEISKWNENKINCWSSWDYDTYNKIHVAIENLYKNKFPLEWENDKWINTSKAKGENNH